MTTRGFRAWHMAATVAALALASGCGGAGATPSPTAGVLGAASPAASPPVARPATSAAPSPAPAGDTAWQPGRYMIAGDLTSVVDFVTDGTAYLTEQPFVTSRDTYRVIGDTITFAGESCSGVTGTYHWSTDGGRVELTNPDDPCPDRATVLGLPLDRLEDQLPYLDLRPSKPFDQPDYNFATAGDDGRFYTTDGLGGFYEYATDGSLVRSWPHALDYTTGITVTKDGTIYVANFEEAAIHVFGADGKPLRQWTVDGGTIGPVGLAHDAKGDIYVALHRYHDHYIEKYSPKGRLLGAWADGAPSYGMVSDDPGPSDIAVTPDGTSYLGDPGNNRLLKFAADGTFVASFTGDGTHKLVSPSVLAANAMGDVFAVSRPLRILWAFDQAGKVVGRWYSPYDASVVVDDGGNVWLVGRQIMAVGLPGS